MLIQICQVAVFCHRITNDNIRVGKGVYPALSERSKKIRMSIIVAYLGLREFLFHCSTLYRTCADTYTLVSKIPE